MQYNKNFKQRNSSIQGLRSFRDTLPKKIKKIIDKKGHIYSETLNNLNPLEQYEAATKSTFTNRLPTFFHKAKSLKDHYDPIDLTPYKDFFTTKKSNGWLSGWDGISWYILTKIFPTPESILRWALDLPSTTGENVWTTALQNATQSLDTAETINDLIANLTTLQNLIKVQKNTVKDLGAFTIVTKPELEKLITGIQQEINTISQKFYKTKATTQLTSSLANTNTDILTLLMKFYNEYHANNPIYSFLSNIPGFDKNYITMMQNAANGILEGLLVIAETLFFVLYTLFTYPFIIIYLTWLLTNTPPNSSLAVSMLNNIFSIITNLAFSLQSFAGYMENDSGLNQYVPLVSAYLLGTIGLDLYGLISIPGSKNSFQEINQTLEMILDPTSVLPENCKDLIYKVTPMLANLNWHKPETGGTPQLSDTRHDFGKTPKVAVDTGEPAIFKHHPN
jgi:hypothetical protein